MQRPAQAKQTQQKIEMGVVGSVFRFVLAAAAIVIVTLLNALNYLAGAWKPLTVDEAAIMQERIDRLIGENARLHAENAAFIEAAKGRESEAPPAQLKDLYLRISNLKSELEKRDQLLHLLADYAGCANDTTKTGPLRKLAESLLYGDEDTHRHSVLGRILTAMDSVASEKERLERDRQALALDQAKYLESVLQLGNERTLLQVMNLPAKPFLIEVVLGGQAATGKRTGQAGSGGDSQSNGQLQAHFHARSRC